MIIIRGRQFEILIFLLKNKKTTYKDLSEKFEVSTKTIERDVNYLSSMGVPIFCLQGSGGGVFIDEKYKLSRSFFTNEDIHHIVLALTAFDSITGQSSKANILNKLCLITPELTTLFEKDATDYFIVDLVEEKVEIPNTIMESINLSLDDEVFISLVVSNQHCTVAPISYVLKTDGMYLYCFETKYMLIKISDIEECFVTSCEFTRDFISYNNNKNNII